MEPPSPPPNRRFAVPGVAWLAAAACAFAPLAGAVKRAVAGDLSLYGGTVALALAAAFVLLPFAAARLAWRLSRQREPVVAGVFYLTLVVTVGGAFWQATRAARVRDETVASEARALATQLVQRESGRGPAPGAPTPAEGADNTALGAAIRDAQRAVKSRLASVQIMFDDAASAVAPETFFDLRPLTSAEAIAARRGEVETFAEAIQVMRQSTDFAAFYFSSELRDRQVPETTVREVVAAYRAATEKALPRLKRLREKDGALALLMTQFLEYAESALGQWRIDPASRMLAFEDAAVQARYEEIRRTALVIERERRQIRADLAR
jgi:hypothetical protein